MFMRLFNEINPDIEFKIYDIRQHDLPEDVNECDSYITTGSRTSTYDELDWIPPFRNLFKDLFVAKKKLVGVCFGHQLISDTFGGYTELSDKGWGVGVSINKIIKSKPWMNPLLDEINIIVSHQDQVTQLPDDAELIAGSDFCPHYMYQIGNEILTIQGHPEFNKDYSETLMKHRKNKLGDAALQHGLNSLSLEVHADIVMRWIYNFMCDN